MNGASDGVKVGVAVCVASIRVGEGEDDRVRDAMPEAVAFGGGKVALAVTARVGVSMGRAVGLGVTLSGDRVRLRLKVYVSDAVPRRLVRVGDSGLATLGVTVGVRVTGGEQEWVRCMKDIVVVGSCVAVMERSSEAVTAMQKRNGRCPNVFGPVCFPNPWHYISDTHFLCIVSGDETVCLASFDRCWSRIRQGTPLPAQKTIALSHNADNCQNVRALRFLAPKLCLSMHWAFCLQTAAPFEHPSSMHGLCQNCRGYATKHCHSQPTACSVSRKAEAFSRGARPIRHSRGHRAPE